MADKDPHTWSPIAAYGRLSPEQREAEAKAQVAAADTPTALLRLCLPSVSHDASCGIVGARDLLNKISQVLRDQDPA